MSFEDWARSNKHTLSKLAKSKSAALRELEKLLTPAQFKDAQVWFSKCTSTQRYRKELKKLLSDVDEGATEDDSQALDSHTLDPVSALEPVPTLEPVHTPASEHAAPVLDTEPAVDSLPPSVQPAKLEQAKPSSTPDRERVSLRALEALIGSTQTLINSVRSVNSALVTAIDTPPVQAKPQPAQFQPSTQLQPSTQFQQSDIMDILRQRMKEQRRHQDDVYYRLNAIMK